MVATVDGAATGDDGKSRSINNGVDKMVFDLLRELADALVVGAGTMRIEGYAVGRSRWSWCRAADPCRRPCWRATSGKVLWPRSRPRRTSTRRVRCSARTTCWCSAPTASTWPG